MASMFNADNLRRMADNARSGALSALEKGRLATEAAVARAGV